MKTSAFIIMLLCSARLAWADTSYLTDTSGTYKGKPYVERALMSELARTPNYNIGDGEPPVSVHAAYSKAKAALVRLDPDADTRCSMVLLVLQPADAPGKAYYQVRFLNLMFLVLMDGTVIEPEFQP